jgi:hypothetical protein
MPPPPNAIVIRPARPAEAAELTALARRSKASWGYSEQFMRSCEVELSYDALQIERGDFLFAIAEAAGDGEYLVAQADPHAEGFYRAVGGEPIGSRESAKIPGRYLPLFKLLVSRT